MAGWWEDFSNNLATDLAPLIALFGESPTKQYLSECLSFIDILIFSTAPLGIITTVVSAIRVRGTPSLRAFIGRAQEGGSNAEAELCSSTSRDVCELYNNGGIARVFGRPKLIEVVLDLHPEATDFYKDDRGNPGSAGVYTFREYMSMLKRNERLKRGQGEKISKSGSKQSSTAADKSRSPSLVKEQDEKTGKPGDWEEIIGRRTGRDSEDVETNTKHDDKFIGEDLDYEKFREDNFAPNPNLSLNIGIKKPSRKWFVAAAVVGVVLQSAVLVWAVVARYKFRFIKEDPTDKYAVPITVIGTISLALGVGLCAFLIESSTEERWFKRKREEVGSHMYWVQPGNQYVGDQAFDSFAYSDRRAPLTQYISSRKKPESGLKHAQNPRSVKSDKGPHIRLVYTAVGLTALGFIMQFLGLRACHSSVAVAQLGVMLVMSMVRALLRTQRMEEDDNCLRDRPDAYVGHELDWLALYMDIGDGTTSLPKHDETRSVAHWKIPSSAAVASFQGTELKLSSAPRNSQTSTPDKQNDMAKPDKASKWLKEQYALNKTQVEKSVPHELARRFLYRSRLARMTVDWNDDFVASRAVARQLAYAITETAKVLFFGSTLKKEWKDVKSLYWPIRHDCSHGPRQDLGGELIYLALTRVQPDTRPSAWTVDDYELEAVLGLWAWTLKEQMKSMPKKHEGEYTYEAHSNRPTIVRILSVQPDSSYDLALWRHFGSAPIIEGSLSQISPRLLLCGLHNSGSKLSPESRVQAQKLEGTISKVCAQELYSLFFLSILKAAVKEIGGDTTVQESFEGFLLTNTIISHIQQAFTDSGLGSRDDAYACTIPALVASAKLPSARSTLAKARQIAEKYIEDKEWENAKRILEWALLQCWESTKPADPDDAFDFENLQRLIILTLCECYRKSLSDPELSAFAMQGFEDLAVLMRTQTSLSPGEIEYLARDSAPMPRNSSSDSGTGASSSRTLATTVEEYRKAALRIEDIREAPTNETDTVLAEWTGPIITDAAERAFSAKIKSALRNKPEKAFDAEMTHEIQITLLESIRNNDLTGTLYLTSIIQMADWKMKHDGKLDMALLQAAEHGWYPVVRALTELADPDARDSNARTAFTWATIGGDLNTFQHLHKKGSHPNLKDYTSRTPLSYASEKGFLRIVKRLLGDDRVDVDVQDALGQTPLVWAMKSGHEAIVKLLLDKGADANGQSIFYGNVLQVASEGGSEAIVKLLLDKDAEFNTQRDYEEYCSALTAASSKGHEAIVKLLLDTDPTADVRNYGEKPLKLASSNGHEATVKLLLDSGADVNAADFPALAEACNGGHKAIVKLLLDNGANVNARGGIALYSASRHGHKGIVKLLLDSGANVDNDALRAAAEGGYKETVQLLLEKGADVNRHGEINGSPLQEATARGHEATVKLLLDSGADVNVNGGRMGTALEQAARLGYKAIVQLLLDKGADVNRHSKAYGTALQQAAARGREAIVKLLLDSGANVNAGGSDYGNALCAASGSGDEATVKLLLEHGADVNAKGGVHVDARGKRISGLTALQVALITGQKAIVKILLDKGANVNTQGGESSLTALQAAITSPRGDKATMEMLLDNGADVHAQNGIALQVAVETARKEMVQLLVDRGADVNAADGRALQLASHAGNEAIVEILLENGADVHAQNDIALQEASERRHDAVVRLLLDRGADVNAAAGRALQLASGTYRNEAVVKMLLENGADVHAQNNIALQVASSRRHHAIAKLLREYGAKLAEESSAD
jgi:ankyrin repeat protein